MRRGPLSVALTLGLLACGDKAEDPAVTAEGEVAPDFTLVDATGADVSLSDTDGSPRLLLAATAW